MTCYHPLKAFVLGTKENGKKDIKVTSYKVDHLVKNYNKKNYNPSFEDRSLCPARFNCREKLCTYQCIPHYWEYKDWNDPNWKDYRISHPYVQRVVSDYITIPCGQCAGCRIDKSREWANRMMLEMPYSSGSWFVTLTYNDENIPTRLYTADDCNFHKSYTLVKKDLQDFNKRLREHFGTGIRFYAAGEYGSEKWRPHYHIIYWNLELDEADLVPLRRSPEGFMYYTHPAFDDLWPKGFHIITNVTWQTCAYVARYVTKKFHWRYRNTYDFFNIEPEFSTMSLKPGIGRKWFDEHTEEAYKSYIINFSTMEGSLRFKPPGYFDRLYDGLDPVRMAEIKENRRIMADNCTKNKLLQTDKGFLEMLLTEEKNFRDRVKKLDFRKDCL